ncbi:MAG: YgiT-type zinc finger protein, partial [Firmicutes bacterium]|nr:YgiT-type zinc finger protein [Bacillota bacterium]
MGGKRCQGRRPCVICKRGIPQAGTTTVTVERPGTLVVFRQVPAQICP